MECLAVPFGQRAHVRCRVADSALPVGQLAVLLGACYARCSLRQTPDQVSEIAQTFISTSCVRRTAARTLSPVRSVPTPLVFFGQASLVARRRRTSSRS